MPINNLVDGTQLDADLASVANAIRAKGGTTAQLAFPAEFVSAIGDIPSGGGGGGITIQGHGLKYIIPISLTTPSTADQPMTFYSGLNAPTESVIGTLYAPNVNDVSGYTNKLHQFMFSTVFSRGSGAAGYICSQNAYIEYTTIFDYFPGSRQTTLWSDFTNPAYIQHKALNRSAQASSCGISMVGYIFVYDSAYTGAAQLKNLSDTGMSVYFAA